MYKELEALIGKELTKELAEQVHTAYDATIKKLNEESASYRVKLKEVESSLKEQYETQLSDLQKQIAKAKEDGKAEVVKEFETKLTELETQKADLVQKTKNAVIDSTLQKVLSKQEWTSRLGAELIIKQNIHFDEQNDKVMLKVGEELLDVDTGLEKLVEAVPDLKGLVKAHTNQGGGNQGGGNQGSKIDVKSITPEEKAQFIKEYGSEAYLKQVQANLK